MSGRHTAVLEGITVFRRTEEGKRSRNHFPGTDRVRGLYDLERTIVTQKEIDMVPIPGTKWWLGYRVTLSCTWDKAPNKW